MRVRSRSTQDVLLTGIASAGSGLGFLLATRIAAERLDNPGFGAFAVGRQGAIVLSPIASVAMGVAVTRWVSLSTDRAAERAVGRWGAAVATVATAAVALVFWLFESRLTDFLFGPRGTRADLRACLAYLVALVSVEVLAAFYRGRTELRRANALRAASGLAAPLGMVGYELLAGSARAADLLLAAALATGLTAVPAVFGLIGPATPISAHLRREITRFGATRAVGGLAFAATLGLGPLVAPSLGSVGDAGDLAAALAVYPLVEAALAPIGYVSLPYFGQLLALNQLDRIRDLATNLLAMASTIGLVLSVQLAVFGPVLSKVWLGGDHPKAGMYIQILALGVAPFLVYVLLRSPLDALDARAVSTRNLAWCLATTGVAAAGLAAVGLGAEGVAWATTAGLWVLGLRTARHFVRSGWAQFPNERATILFLVALGLACAAGARALFDGSAQMSTRVAAVVILLGGPAVSMWILHTRKVPWFRDLVERLKGAGR